MSRENHERGAAAVEFALVVPVLIFLVFGIAEFGRAYHLQTTLSAAARDGVRVMALQDDPAAAREAVRASAGALAPALTDEQIKVTPTTCAATGTTPAGTALVSVTYEMDFITGLFDAGVTLTGKGTMRCNG
ncbi:TadE/TadG family type IV pilus assembly protein [Georgenia sp. 10Sc9-8]|uniref:TadE/TadG family type IV pilus assembly protein n=1 Tax=Georgenia halotolerans TaxID=3028317 RepID=A0ABT5TX57_9MICO|nr:TadE/TadG family type IV pilus assembly protein [Georgenia halotolerans]